MSGTNPTTKYKPKTDHLKYEWYTNQHSASKSRKVCGSIYQFNGHN